MLPTRPQVQTVVPAADAVVFLLVRDPAQVVERSCNIPLPYVCQPHRKLRA